MLLVAIAARATPRVAARATAPRPTSLVPGTRARDIELAFGRAHAYDVRDLATNAAYEVKVSYRATSAAAITVEVDASWFGGGWFGGGWFGGGARDETTAEGRTELRRRLLNVEKLVLSRRTLGEGVTRARVVVRAEREGVYWAGATAPKYVTYDVEVQPLLAAGKFGEVPKESVGMICLCVAFVALAIAGARFVSDDIVWRACDELDARKRRYAAAHASATHGISDITLVSLNETIRVPVSTITTDD
jgi:hypothetical protein